MRIQEVQLKWTSSLGIVDSCSYKCNQLVFTGQVLVVQALENAEYYINDPNPSRGISLFYFPCSETFESASFGDGRIVFNTTAGDTDIYAYEYFLKDHLGSTRMVINDEYSVTEAAMYHAYGTMVSVGSNSSAIPVREQFTGKELDQEGGSGGVGIKGMELFYFGARYYNPELGVWLSTDPKDQLFNPYGYANNPIIYIDPDGQYIIGAIIGAIAGAYIGGAMSNGSLNPGKWDWDNPSTLMGVFSGALSGAMLGSGIENNIIASRMYNGSISSGYGLSAGRHLLQNGFYDSWMASRGIISQIADMAQNGRTPQRYGEQARREANQRAIMQAGPARNAPARALEPIEPRTTNFVVTPRGEAVQIPEGAQGPHPTRASGMQYFGGTGANEAMRPDVTGVRIMDANWNQGPRAIYMTPTGSPINPYTGSTQPAATHYYLLPWGN